MKKLNCFICGIIATLAFISCRKESDKQPPVTSIVITNTVVDGTTVKLGSNPTTIPSYSYRHLSVVAGETDLYLWPVGDSINPYFTKQKFITENGEVYSLFVGGQFPSVSGVLVKDEIPYHIDSTCGVRIVNMSPDSDALNVTLSTTPTLNEVSNLTYLQYTDFKLYPAKSSNAIYEFQVRKSSDNSIIASYELSTPYFSNVTLVIGGLSGGSAGISITEVLNDK